MKIDNSVAKCLGAAVAEQGTGSLIISTENPRGFCDFVRALSRHVFPAARYVVSPYSFRHAFAADQKAVAHPVETIAAMLGHVSGRSQRTYGHANQGRHPLSHIVEAKASRPVRPVSGWVEYAAQQAWNVNPPQPMVPGF